MEREDSITTTITFFENEMLNTIFIYEVDGELVMSERPPSKGEKKKVVFFTKVATYEKIEKNK